MVKTGLDLFSLGCIYEVKKVTESDRQGIKTRRSFLLNIDPWCM